MRSRTEEEKAITELYICDLGIGTCGFDTGLVVQLPSNLSLFSIRIIQIR
jgi:hypothetical protein